MKREEVTSELSRDAADSPPAAKQPWESPTLHRLGDAADLTAADGGVVTDASFGFS